MTNICVSGPIIPFHDQNRATDEFSGRSCPNLLREREEAERVAAKTSATMAGRLAHQELAESLCSARKDIEAARPPKRGPE
jgi:hypothetical protein